MATGTPFLALFAFFSLTSIYIAVRWFTTDAFKVRNFTWVSKIVSVVYILLVLISQYILILNIQKLYVELHSGVKPYYLPLFRMF